MEPTGVDRLNRLFDRLPREVVRVGARELPAFRSLGILGYHLALLTAVLTGLLAGVPVLDVVGLSATAACSFFGWALLRRAVTGRETLVLFEHVWVAILCVTAYLLATGGPLRPGLDALSVGLCVFLAFGRFGCLTVGCCHGHPSGIGVVYAGVRHHPDRLVGVRLFPVPLVEGLALLGIGSVGLALADARPGTATVWFLAAYAVVRFGAEALRGDRRPRVWGIPVARGAAVVQLLVALVASEAWLAAGGIGRRQLAAAVPLTVALLGGLLLDRRRRDPLASPDHLDETWAWIVGLARSAPIGSGRDSPPATATTSLGLHLAASWSAAGLHVSFSHPGQWVGGLAHVLGLAPLARTTTAEHGVVQPERVRHPPREQASAVDAEQPYAPSGRTTDTVLQGISGNGYFGDRSDI